MLTWTELGNTKLKNIHPLSDSNNDVNESKGVGIKLNEMAVKPLSVALRILDKDEQSYRLAWISRN